jgi:hypothetical protein
MGFLMASFKMAGNLVQVFLTLRNFLLMILPLFHIMSIKKVRVGNFTSSYILNLEQLINTYGPRERILLVGRS